MLRHKIHNGSYITQVVWQTLSTEQHAIMVTSNGTAVTKVPSASARLFASTWRPLVSVITTLLCCDFFHHRVRYCVLSLCVFAKIEVRHHPHPLVYLCAKFCFFHSLHCWASPQRKITYSITHSLSLFDATGTEALALRKMQNDK